MRFLRIESILYVCIVKANEKLRVMRVMKGYSQEVVANQLGQRTLNRNG